MSINAGPNLASNSGLICWLDAGSTKSYSGSGSTWTDLSGLGNHATLQNSPSWSRNSGGGSFTLDGASQYISCATSGFAPASLTVEYWIMNSEISGATDGGYFLAIDNFDNPELRMQFQGGKAYTSFYDDGAYFWNANSNTNFNNNTWYYLSITVTNGAQQMFVNGSLEVSATGIYTGGTPGENTIGTYNRPGAGYGGYFSGKIGMYKFYNRILTSGEIVQNFNAHRGRYGI